MRFHYKSYEKFELSKKTGFKILNPEIPVIILDFRGKLFYSNEGLKRKDTFNLPAGTYYRASGDFVKMKHPVEYRMNKLPRAQRKYEFPFDFQFDFGNVPQKAVINWQTKQIIFDEKLKDLTLPELYYILYHEFAHARFTSEKYTDRLAENMMLQKGFNPSQTGAAPITTLSKKQLYRKKDSLIRNLLR